MNCPRCATAAGPSDAFCQRCGSPLGMPPPGAPHPGQLPAGYAPLPPPAGPPAPKGASLPPPAPIPAAGDYGVQRYAAPSAQPPAIDVSVAPRRTLAGFLVSFQDDPHGRFWPVWQGRNVIGRADTGQAVDIAIAHGTTSTHHAAIDCDADRWTITDLGSTNRTFHNEQPLAFQGRADLVNGDQIRFGGFSTFTMMISGGR